MSMVGKIEGIGMASIAPVYQAPESGSAQAAPEVKEQGSQAEVRSTSPQEAVAVSADGDTLEASVAGQNASGVSGTLVTASEDGAVSVVGEEEEEKEVSTNGLDTKPSPAERAIEQNEAREEKKEAIGEREEDSEQITGLAGFTRQQVEQLYQQGKISRGDYDRNMAMREEREAESAEEDQTAAERVSNAQEAVGQAAETAQGVTESAALIEENKVLGEAIDRAAESGKLDVVKALFE